MLRLLIILFTFWILHITASQASMPFYEDDEEFVQCTKLTNDWDTCAKEENLRVLNTVKREYRSILGNAEILKWHTSLDESSQTLQDMYESWTAFRNRFCSLSHKAAQYTESFVSEKIACNLYYTQHHQDHLNDVLLLMNRKAPKNRQDFYLLFLDDDEHDAEYAECLQTKNHSECIAEETARSTAAIKKVYADAIKDKYVSKWNNGNGLKSGNYRDMFDSWIAYRNRICSLAVWAYKNYYGENAIELNDCIQYFNYEKLVAFTNILTAARGTLDIDIDEMDDDGGAAEGRTIKPLERRIDSGSDVIEELEIPNQTNLNSSNNLPPKKANLPATDASGKIIPAWAQPQK